MAVEDEYEVSPLRLVDEITAYFAAVGLPVGVDYGARAIARQLNTGEQGRVVLNMVGGRYTGGRRMGSRSADAVELNAYQLEADVEVHITAWDDTAPDDDKAQEAAWFRLHEYTLAAIRKKHQGRFKPERLGPGNGPVNLRHGISRVLQFSIQVPVQYPPDSTPKLQLTAAVTVQTNHPQGADAAGEPIPPVIKVVAGFTVP